MLVYMKLNKKHMQAHHLHNSPCWSFALIHDRHHIALRPLYGFDHRHELTTQLLQSSYVLPSRGALEVLIHACCNVLTATAFQRLRSLSGELKGKVDLGKRNLRR
jgi:hypothetical protein